MKKIPLNIEYRNGLSIIIFAEGTILKPKSWLSIYRHNAYVPIGNAVAIINSWQSQGANIIYCTSRKKKQTENMALLLSRLGFSGTFLIARENKEKYSDIIEAIVPNILIEDDCKSIGGTWQMCITKVQPKIKDRIVSIVIPEFKGIDKLPVDITNLKNYV